MLTFRLTTIMEGVLLKWTNYLSGWQPRWFVLDNGILSYYKSQEDVNNGCKGSIKMAVCDIVVHQTDMSRLDLIIPGEQHYYVKAGNSQDRQSWLIALGSSKASFSETSTAKKEADALPDQVRVKKSELRLYCDLLMQQVHSVKEMSSSTSEEKWDAEKMNESVSMIGATCDTFIATLEDCMKLVSNTPMFDTPHQHILDAAIPHSPTRANVHRLPGTRSVITNRTPVEKRQRQTSNSSADSIKVHSYQNVHSRTPLMTPRSSSPVAMETTTPSSSSSVPPLQSPPPSSTILSTATTTIIKQQQPVVEKLSSTFPSQTTSESASPIIVNGSASLDEISVSSSYGSGGGVGRGCHTDSLTSSPSHHHHQQSQQQQMQQQSTPALSTATSSDDLEGGDDFKDAIDAKINTFFSNMKPDFSSVLIKEDLQVPITPFLDACTSIVPLFDKLNSTAFAPVKMDFSGNIKKLQQKQQSNPEAFISLQSMVEVEVSNSQHTHSNSATSALLWLKRSLEFIREFLREFSSGSLDLSTCASNAYHRTLKNYHGWVVRGVFAVAVKALPYRDVFINQLYCGDEGDPYNIPPSTTRQFEHALLSDIEAYLVHLDRNITVINDYYTQHSLDCADRV